MHITFPKSKVKKMEIRTPMKNILKRVKKYSFKSSVRPLMSDKTWIDLPHYSVSTVCCNPCKQTLLILDFLLNLLPSFNIVYLQSILLLSIFITVKKKA